MLVPSAEPDPFRENGFDEDLVDEDSPSVGDDLTMAEVSWQLGLFWGAVLVLAVLTGLASKVL